MLPKSSVQRGGGATAILHDGLVTPPWLPLPSPPETPDHATIEAMTLASAPALSLVALSRETVGLAELLFAAISSLSADVRILRLPYFWRYGSRELAQLRTVIEGESRNRFVVFCPDSTELYLPECDFMVVFSAYRSWFCPARMRVVPHVWTPTRAPANSESLIWSRKPPLRVGFMGCSHSTSRAAQLMRRLPRYVRRWLLRGRHLRYPHWIAKLNDCGVSIQHINAFPRIEAVDLLMAARDSSGDLDVDVVQTNSFSGSQAAIADYVGHLARSTYVVCPRGTENYSYRVYEALSFGRVPVIVDTDIVLPPEFNWDQLSVRVPYESLDDIFSSIRHDYESHGTTQFLERQQAALAATRAVRTMSWMDDVAAQIVEAARQSERCRGRDRVRPRLGGPHIRNSIRRGTAHFVEGKDA